MNILHELMKEVFMIEKEQNYDSLSKDLKVDPSLLDDYRSHDVIIINESDVNYTKIYKKEQNHGSGMEHLLIPFSGVFDLEIEADWSNSGGKHTRKTCVFKNVHQITEVQNLKKFMFMYLDDIITMSRINIDGLVKVFNKTVMIKYKKQNEEYLFSVGYLMEKINGKNCNSLSDKESDLYNASKYSIYKRVYKILLRLFDKYKLCHNDLSKHNIMWDSESDKVSIIDIDFRREGLGGSLCESEYFETNNGFINENFIKRDSYEK